MKISEMDDETAAATLLKAYRNICSVYDSDEHGEHPSRTVNSWIRASATGGTNSEKQIEKAQDDDQPEVSGGNGGAQPAQDSMSAAEIENAAIKRSGRHDIEGQLALAAARRAAPKSASVRAMSGAIKGYDRIK